MVSIVECRDCMEAMREFPDKFFDLAIVDPPYGSGNGKQYENGEGGSKWYDRFGGAFKKYCKADGKQKDGDGRKKSVEWDIAPTKEYFDELFRVSRNQIIWGGNYFALPPTRCFIVWRKLNIPLEGFSMAPVEYAWTSFNENAKMYECYSSNIEDRFHPTQKPVSLYTWVLRYFAHHGYKILDTHLGSGSSRIAAYDAGLDFWGYEIDSDYFTRQEQRFSNHTAQISFFEGE